MQVPFAPVIHTKNFADSVELRGGYRLSRRMMQGLLHEVFSLSISLCAITQGEAVLSAALAPRNA